MREWNRDHSKVIKIRTIITITIIIIMLLKLIISVSKTVTYN